SIGASYCGLKTLVAMKNFGLNVAADVLMPFLYTGTNKGACVLIVADDPSCHSSAQSEQNSRPFAYMAHIPTLEPSDPQECFDFTKQAFEISAKFSLPVMIRITTRVAHQKMPVVISSKFKIKNSKLKEGKFIVNKDQYVTMPPRVLAMKDELLAKIEKIRALAETSPLNQVEFRGSKQKNGIIASGVSYLYVKEALNALNLAVPLLKLGFFYPLPVKKIKTFLKPLKQVVIVEELEGFLEKEITTLAKESACQIKIWGKNILPETGELRPEQIIFALAKIFRKKIKPLKRIDFKPNKHLPRFCIGWPTCPYWKLFAAVKQAAPKNTVFGGDIGCYMIAALPPHNLYDYLACMGSSIGIAHGIKKASLNKQKVIAFIGDGTFLHSGIEGLLNAVYNQSNLLLIILDNSITAMTGHQPNPGVGKTGMAENVQPVKIEEIVKALGVKNIQVLDQEEEYEKLIATIKQFIDKKDVSVIIARRICGLLAKRSLKNKEKNEK
ncbi:indolepyruvate ferredoxin oxidoreductase subunit alpha, partial [Candidatus Gribaldobacteria bacterium]|nr:indolepyruvate ferredoxin oxidoreductase subunit alpha [Candidatus Gribaldobacteria bacterium]